MATTQKSSKRKYRVVKYPTIGGKAETIWETDSKFLATLRLSFCKAVPKVTFAVMERTGTPENPPTWEVIT